jgi:hypothetical protein
LVFFISSFFAVQNASAQQCQPPATPALTATAGPGFQQITLSWTGVQGSSGYYSIYGAPIMARLMADHLAIRLVRMCIDKIGCKGRNSLNNDTTTRQRNTNDTSTT